MNKEITPAARTDLIQALQNSHYPEAKPESVALALDYCHAISVDPLLKPVHIVPMWSKTLGALRDVIMPGIALYRIMAARTGEYAGIGEPEFGPIKTIGNVSYPEWCKITVKRIVKNNIVEFTAKEYWLENYATVKKDSSVPNSMWTKRARGQIAKCAEAQALRKAFPESCSGYTAEEMQGKGDYIEGEYTAVASPEMPHDALLDAHKEPMGIVELKVLTEGLISCVTMDDLKECFQKFLEIIKSYPNKKELQNKLSEAKDIRKAEIEKIESEQFVKEMDNG